MRSYGPYSLESVAVPPVQTAHRCIRTSLPVPESIPCFEKLLEFEPPSMSGQPPILWDHAEGYNVHDRFGNRWIDFSSCVLVANIGHGHPRVIERLREMLDRRQLATYVFAHEERAELVEKLVGLAPEGLEKVYLLTTGSEAVECAIKLARTWGRRENPDKSVVVSFRGGFHGRTLGSQLAGGIPVLKTWIGGEDQTFVQVPFPDGYFQEDTSFELFERSLEAAGVAPANVAGVLSETYLGIGPDFFPVDYARSLREWCDRHGAVLIFDEVQSGFGRTGKIFAYEHYGIEPDLIVCGKAISSSLPLSAVIGRADILSTYAPGSMTSTHSGSPLPVAAGIASVDILLEARLEERAASLEPVLKAGLERIVEVYREADWLHCRGLVAGIRMAKGGSDMAKPGGREPDAELATRINESCFRKGLLMFAPVGLGSGCIKIAPPLTIPRDALEEGLTVLEESFAEVLS